MSDTKPRCPCGFMFPVWLRMQRTRAWRWACMRNNPHMSQRPATSPLSCSCVQSTYGQLAAMVLSTAHQIPKGQQKFALHLIHSDSSAHVTLDRAACLWGQLVPPAYTSLTCMLLTSRRLLPCRAQPMTPEPCILTGASTASSQVTASCKRLSLHLPPSIDLMLTAGTQGPMPDPCRP